jgi:hypothetical protein
MTDRGLLVHVDLDGAPHLVGLAAKEIERMATAFEHEDLQKAIKAS